MCMAVDLCFVSIANICIYRLYLLCVRSFFYQIADLGDDDSEPTFNSATEYSENEVCAAGALSMLETWITSSLVDMGTESLSAF